MHMRSALINKNNRLNNSSGSILPLSQNEEQAQLWKEKPCSSVWFKINNRCNNFIMATADGGNRAVIDALALGQIERASLLLSEGSPLDLQRATEVVIDKGQYGALKFLLSNYKLHIDKHFLLHHALVLQQEDIAKLLVESGADVNNYHETGPRLRDYEEGCAHYSCYLPLQLSLFCSLDMTHFLLESGADVNKRNVSQETAFIFACATSVGADRVADLLEHGAKVNTTDGDKATGLHWAVRVGNIETVTLLIDGGADIEAKDVYGCTALMWACRNSVGVGCLNILLEKGADCRAMDFNRETGLHLAAKSGNSITLKLLIQYGAQFEARTLTGDTALILACEKSVPAECVRILLENGAFPNVQNRDRKTPLDLAKETRFREKIQNLLQYGATEEDKIDQEKTDLMQACGKTGNTRSVLRLLQNNVSPNVKNHRGKTALHIAVVNGDIKTLKVLVQYKADVNAIANDYETPLMLACTCNSVNVECVKFLLKHKALLNVTDITGKTAFHKAAVTGDIRKLKRLVQHGADVNPRNIHGQTPLMLACAKKSVNVECVKFLLKNKALPNLTDINGDTVLYSAALGGDIKKLKILLQHGADVNARNIHGQTALMLACANRSVNVECIKFLLDNKALLDVTDIKGETAFHCAVRSRDIERMKILVQYGADVNAKDEDHNTPLMLPCADSSFNLECVKFLLENKALPNMTDRRGDTALHKVIPSGNIELMKILLKYGADVNARDGNKQTPLVVLCGKCRETTPFSGDNWRKRSEIIKLLVQHGADLEARTSRGETPLFTAAQTGNRQLIELLYDLGADVCAEDGEGQNAIMLAMETAHRNRKTCDRELFQYWIDKGVSVNHRDKNGKTALILAAKYGDADSFKYLIEAGADVHAVGTDETERGSEEVTALSIFLEKTRWTRSNCVELIRHGAVNSLPERFNGFLHRMILWNRREMIHLLLANGMAPTMSDSLRLLRFDPVGPASPLTVALYYVGNIPVIQYLLGNLMLCPCDIYGHSYFSQWRQTLISENRTDVVTLMDEFYSQPKSLFQLSFVIVSHALGGVPGRVDRVNSLPLPSKFKDRLLFKSIDIPMDPI